MSFVRVVSVESAVQETIELVAVPPCTSESTRVRDSEAVRFLRRGEDTPAFPALTIVLADARACVTIAPPITAQSLSNVVVAIVAVDSLGSFESSFVSSAFDAVLPVVVEEGEAPEPPLAAALAAVTAFATATVVGLPVAEACRLFLGAGRLALGRGEGLDMASATRHAVRHAREMGGHRDGRFLVHLEVGVDALKEGLRHASTALASLRTEDRFMAVSMSSELRRRAAVLLSWRQSKAANA